MSNENARTLLVTGASGHLGRRVVELLLDRGGGDRVIAASRTTDKLADLAKKGAEVRRADFDDAASLEAAFAGVDRLLIVSTDALDRPGRRLEQHLAAVAAAKRAGVKHVVYTSLTDPIRTATISIANDHAKTEEALKSSGLAHTVLRNALYTDLFAHTLPRAVATGTLAAAVGTQGVGYVTREDCARAAAAALAARTDSSAVYEVTGPEVVTHAQLAGMLSELSGKTVTYAPITEEALRAGLAGAGLPPPVVDLYASFDRAISQGLLAVHTDAVQRLTGRAPQSVRAFLEANRGAFAGQ